MNKVEAVIFGVMISAAITTDTANGTTTVTDEVGKDVKLSLKSNPTTGCGWMIKDPLNRLIFVSGGYERSKDYPKSAVGCDGEEVLHFIGEKKGESTLKLIYGRSFDKLGWQKKEVEVVIK